MPDVVARYEALFDFSTFFWVFSYIADEHLYLKYCIFTKHSQILHLGPTLEIQEHLPHKKTVKIRLIL